MNNIYYFPRSLSLPIVILLFTPQKQLHTTSYPKNLFEERDLSDASDIDISGDQDYLLEEKECNTVRSYFKWSSLTISCLICWGCFFYLFIDFKLLRMPKRPSLPGLVVMGKSNSRKKKRKHSSLKDFLFPTEYLWQRWVLFKKWTIWAEFARIRFGSHWVYRSKY